jgi:hypothetical protein
MNSTERRNLLIKARALKFFCTVLIALPVFVLVVLSLLCYHTHVPYMRDIVGQKLVKWAMDAIHDRDDLVVEYVTDRRRVLEQGFELTIED